MRIVALAGLRAADLPPLRADLGDGLVALVGTPEDAAEVRRALVWGVTTGDGGVRIAGTAPGATPGAAPADSVERLWGSAGGASEAVDAAVEWIAGAPLARVEAARAALAAGRVRTPPPSARAEAMEERLRTLDDAPEAARAGEVEVRDLRAEWTEAAGDVEEATMEWLRERQDAETQLQAYRDRARELRARLAQLEDAGADAPCPTCGRPLADHLTDVRVQLREEWESVVQDGSWWKRRREQLEDKPGPLRDMEQRALRLHAAMQDAAERLEVARARVREREALRASVPPDLGSPEARALARLAAELRDAGTRAVLREAGLIAERVTAGRILWIRPGEEGPVALGVFHGGAPAARDRAAVDLCCRLAAARLARAAGAPLDGIVVAEALEVLDPEDRVRAVEALAELARALGQVVVVTGTDLVEHRPEAFDQALQLRGDGEAPVALQPLAVGETALVLTG